MRVNVLRVGKAAAATGLLVAAGPGSLGCAAEPEDGEPVTETNDALSPGTATLVLGGGPADLQVAETSTDEFLRAGQVIHIRMTGWHLWSLLYPADPVPNDVNRLKALAPALQMRPFDKALALTPRLFPGITWNMTNDVWALEATTGALTIPAKADTIRFQLTITDAMNPGAMITLDMSQLPSAHVFSGELPSKSLLFDNLNGTKRQRIIEGDQIVASAPLLFGVSDWRADQVVDKLTIDTQIGVGQAAGRFGWYEYPIYGALQYEVRYGIKFDDTKMWQPEQLMAGNAASVLLPIGATGRTVYETAFTVPLKATKVSIYLHIKAFLIADYSGHDVVQQWYQQGSSTLVRDSYDNPNGPFTNYDYSLQK
jgi:hypothetical protein